MKIALLILLWSAITPLLVALNNQEMLAHPNDPGIKSKLIDSIPKPEDVNFENYGSDLPCGVSVGGGGLVGGSVRHFVYPKIAAEAGIFYKPVVEITNYDSYVYHGITLSAGGNWYLKNEKFNYRFKIRKSGIAFQVGHTFSAYPHTFIGGGWFWEKFKKQNTLHSF